MPTDAGIESCLLPIHLNKEVMTLQECKDKVAEKHGLTNWGNACFVWAGFVKQIEPLMDEAAELYAQQRVEEATRWIPVSERLPEINCSVAVRTKNKETAIMSFHAHPEEGREFHRWMFGKWQKQTSIVTHWTTIPPLPKSPTV